MKSHIICVLGVCLFAQACYKDLSTGATMEIPEIVISGVDSVINVTYGQDLNIKATVSQIGRTQSDFTFLWEMDVTPNKDAERFELSETSELSYRVSNSPSDSPYALTLKVTDNKTGLTKVNVSKVYVSSSLGEGLLVAYTRDGGKTSEFDIVADPVLTYGYTGTTRYTRKLYSLANGDALGGKVLSLAECVYSNGALYNENAILIGTEDHLYNIDPLTFEVRSYDASLFNSVKEDSFGTSAVCNFGDYSTVAAVNGTLYGISTLLDSKFSKVAFSKSPSNIFRSNNFGYCAQSQGNLTVFNENDGKIYFISALGVYNGALAEISESFGFDGSGATAIGGGCVKGKRPSILIRDASGSYHICSYDSDSATPYAYDVNGTDMDKIVSVAFCDNADLMYYATEDKIYAVLITGSGTSTAALTWKPDSSNEKITGLKHYTQGWYGTHQYGTYGYEFVLPYNRLQLLITTYNETTGEGKIYMRPFNVSTGRFTSRSNGTLTGFGQITAIATTFK